MKAKITAADELLGYVGETLAAAEVLNESYNRDWASYQSYRINGGELLAKFEVNFEELMKPLVKSLNRLITCHLSLFQLDSCSQLMSEFDFFSLNQELASKNAAKAERKIEEANARF